MKCFCCHRTFDSQLTRCPHCGFPVVFLPDGTQICEDDLKSEITEFRKDKFGSTQIRIARYFWKKSGEEIILDRKEFVEIADGLQLLEKGQVWLDQSFARTVSNPSISIEYQLGESAEVRKVQIDVPKEVGFWQIGAELTEDMYFRFLLKSNSEIKKSETVSLI